LLGISCIILRVVIKGVSRGLLTLFIVTIAVVQGNRPPCAPLLLLVLLVVVVARLIRGQVTARSNALL